MTALSDPVTGGGPPLDKLDRRAPAATPPGGPCVSCSRSLRATAVSEFFARENSRDSVPAPSPPSPAAAAAAAGAAAPVGGLAALGGGRDPSSYADADSPSTQRHRDTETKRHRDTETQRHRDTDTQTQTHRHTDTHTRQEQVCTEAQRHRRNGTTARTNVHSDLFRHAILVCELRK